MKKLFATVVFATALFAAQNANGQTQQCIVEGKLFLECRTDCSYFIRDKEHQQTYEVKVTREKDSDGNWLYTVTCGNRYSKRFLKYGLSAGITAVVAYTGVGAFWSGSAAVMSAEIYDHVCEYFKDDLKNK